MDKFHRQTTQERGRWAEQLAVNWLHKQGLREICRNYRCRRGEIDLIMQHHQAMVFIEVRYRASLLYGNACETIDLRKRDRIMKAAQHFLITHPRLASLPCRFDVVSVHGTFQDPELGWIQGAFEA